MTDQQQIFDAIPHRDPFLFVDEIVRWDESEIVCKKTFTGKEFFFAGHYPHYPLTPGVILCEAAMQAGAIFLSKYFKETHDSSEKGVPVVGRMNDVKFREMVRPGDEVIMQVTLTEQMKDVFFMKAKVTVCEPQCSFSNGKTAVTFNFACKMVAENERDEG